MNASVIFALPLCLQVKPGAPVLIKLRAISFLGNSVVDAKITVSWTVGKAQGEVVSLAAMGHSQAAWQV